MLDPAEASQQIPMPIRLRHKGNGWHGKMGFGQEACSGVLSLMRLRHISGSGRVFFL